MYKLKYIFVYLNLNWTQCLGILFAKSSSPTHKLLPHMHPPIFTQPISKWDLALLCIFHINSLLPNHGEWYVFYWRFLSKYERWGLLSIVPKIASFFFFLSFLGLHLLHMEAPRLGGRIGAAAASLHHSHSNTVSKLHLWPTLELAETPDPWPTEQGQGSNPRPHGC